MSVYSSHNYSESIFSASHSIPDLISRSSLSLVCISHVKLFLCVQQYVINVKRRIELSRSSPSGLDRNRQADRWQFNVCKNRQSHLDNR